MKVLSLIEPWASLILNNIKKIETRSWKTNYRGELYIHASLTKIKKDKHIEILLNMLGENELHYGEIICKCELIDCIYMDEEFITKIKENEKEYLCGEYEIGRYAWILNNIKPICPINAKGHLGIWEYEEGNKE